jgi:phosphoenolpyruvate synthase/pyruvate phosphate dikinase
MIFKKIKFSTKAKNLENLIKVAPEINVLPILIFNVKEWRLNHIELIEIVKKEFGDKKLIVRSSKQDEDMEGSSRAGAYLSLQNIDSCFNEIADAVNRVVNSYGKEVHPNDQVFIQPMLENVVCSGVLFTREMSNGAPYRVINYSDISTDAVTSGGKLETNKFTQYRYVESNQKNEFSKLINASKILEKIFDSDKLDIEFGINNLGEIFIFQVRPLKIPCLINFSDEEISQSLSFLESRVDQWFKPHPHLVGENTILGVMPDWNPAEIIGIRPRQLAISLYKELVTDSIWAYQRSNYGYKNLRSFPLMLNILGLPYIDVRVSFNSFLPKTISKSLGNKLVNYYIRKLISSPSLHDKVEFEIVLSCYTFDIEFKTDELIKAGFSEGECEELTIGLKKLTNEIIKPNGIVDDDIRKINILCSRFEDIKMSELSDIEKIYWLLEDCKRYGTLPFAGLARAAFISVQILTSLVKAGAITNEEREQFLGSISTVGTCISNDIKYESKEKFIKKYGHLRPGTYDINSKRYDEAADDYFKWNSIRSVEMNSEKNFIMNADLKSRIDKIAHSHGLNTNAIDLFSFIRKSIEAREESKFLFTKNLSEALRLIEIFGQKYNLSRDDMSYANIEVFYELYSGLSDVKSLLIKSIEHGKKAYETSKLIYLPTIIKSKFDIKEFYSDTFLPNYITSKKAVGFIVNGEAKNNLKEKIVFIECADPGYDWIFTHEIKGFVTAYGGANSHMAIRANELGIPAIVGAGEQLFNQWKEFKYIEIDCENHLVKGLS